MGEIASNAARHSSSDGVTERDGFFHPLADELMAIAGRLRDAATTPRLEDVGTSAPTARPTRASRNYLALARKAYALRRRRATIFGNPDLFGEPAWDILLDLYIAHAEGKAVSVSSACIGSAAPATTGLRWLGVLADEGFVARENDHDDQRRVMVRLIPSGLAAMEQFFDAVDGGN